MNSFLRRGKLVYASLPPWARGVAASAYGHYLSWWRYGRDTEAQVEAALERETWTRSRWHAYQEERLAELLHRAATRVPYYREYWARRRSVGDHADHGDLRNWPVLPKTALRREPSAFLADDVHEKSLFRVVTSGTSGTPITVWRSRRSYRRWYALFEARSRRWYGVHRGSRWAMLGGKAVIPASQREPPYWVWNGGLRQLYLSALHLSEGNGPAYAAAMKSHGVVHLLGYASSMYWLAKIIQKSGVAGPRLEVVVSNAEPFHPHQRAVIGEVFDCPVRDSYGMVEMVAGASECEGGALHLWPDAGVVEVMHDDDDVGVPAGHSGRLICTGLLNGEMPLIRYDVGDRGAVRDWETAAECSCGRSLPVLERIEGRVSDNLIAADGRSRVYVGAIFNDLAVSEAQIVQESLGLVRVNAVPDQGFTEATARTIAERIRARLGQLEVEIQTVDRVPRGANGKFKSVVNAVEGEAPTGEPAQ